uniref:Bifunctional inhibitor/plant lipid transfer protein/seed storage helical domain-containing protein n=1 Tax=Populus trichocarpa TaxID=3694 RepID=A0A3N7G1K5_POPTR
MASTDVGFPFFFFLFCMASTDVGFLQDQLGQHFHSDSPPLQSCWKVLCDRKMERSSTLQEQYCYLSLRSSWELDCMPGFIGSTNGASHQVFPTIIACLQKICGNQNEP